MTLHDLMDPIYDPAEDDPAEDAPAEDAPADHHHGQPYPWVGTWEDGEPIPDAPTDDGSASWGAFDGDPIGGEGGGE